MSLIKQLWVGIIIILILALGGSFFISTLSARHYLEQQLQLKNIDNATSLALSMSQLDKDPVTLELLLAAQFDSGHYQYIRFIDPQGEVIAERLYEEEQAAATTPGWFQQLLALNVTPGIAKVQDGWQQYGTLEIKSHTRYAIDALWQGTLQLLQWFLIAALVCGLVGTLILKAITRPLHYVVRQAEAIGQRHFITSSEPKTQEFRRLVRAMNRLSQSVKEMLDQETRQLEKLQQQTLKDKITDLPNREHFLNLLESTLTREDSAKHALACILRLQQLNELNKTLGHNQVDKLLTTIAERINIFVAQHPDNYAGRLNGTDFCLISFHETGLKNLAADLSSHIQKIAEDMNIDLQSFGIPVAGCHILPDDTRGKLLSRLDGALASAEQKGNLAVITIGSDSHPTLQRNLQEWRLTLESALQGNQLALGSFAVRGTRDTLIHWEKPVRLQLDGNWQPAGYFVGWAQRLELLQDIDLLVLQEALKHIQEQGEATAINLSESALCSASFRNQALNVLRTQADTARQLWIEFPESCAVRHLSQLREFCHELRELGCQLGLEHIGTEFTQIRELQDIGLQYLKIDSALIRDIHDRPGNQKILQGLCTIGHSLGIQLIAEGVTNQAEITCLIDLGLDGFTGPGVS